MFTSKLKEALICLRAGKVTLPYPLVPMESPEGFRGRVVIDVNRCIGCGGCAEVCPTRLIRVSDPSPEKRVLELELERCVHCGRCEEVCPEQAITLTREFETATNDSHQLRIRAEIFMGPCQRCGRCYIPPTALDEMQVTGFRQPQPEPERQAEAR
ncbi:MAG TPA: 4Fe-4S dicluster domain-containing protein [Armatimonadota bacterium]|nr:4Fe-4S dicluster domain-containing protein [Armatimonadota bacterium]